MTRMKKFLWLFILLAASSAWAQTQGVVIVNDRLITRRDVGERRKLLEEMADEKTLKQVRDMDRAVLELLIEETIKLNAAERYGINITKEDVESAARDIEKRSGKAQGSLLPYLEGKNIDKMAFENYVKADLAWIKLVQGKFGSIAPVSEKRAQDELRKIEEKNAQTHYLIGEIFLPVQGFSDNQRMLRLGNEIIDNLQHGASFKEMAYKYSKAPSAEFGGEKGYVAEADLPKELKEKIKDMRVGGLTPPTLTETGYYIIYLADKKLPPVMEKLPSLEQIKNGLYGQFLENAANSYLADLKKQAVIIYK